MTTYQLLQLIHSFIHSLFRPPAQIRRIVQQSFLTFKTCSECFFSVQSSTGYVDQQYPSQPPYGWCRTTPTGYYAHPPPMSGYAVPPQSGYYAPPPPGAAAAGPAAGYPGPSRYVINDRVLTQPAPGFGPPFNTVARNIPVTVSLSTFLMRCSSRTVKCRLTSNVAYVIHRNLSRLRPSPLLKFRSNKRYS